MAGKEPEPAPRRQRQLRAQMERLRKPLVVVDKLEDLAHYAVSALLLAIAVIVLYQTVHHLWTNRHDFGVQATTGINDVLFVVIVLELLRTVVAHLESSDFQLRPFLIIGIISAVRHILTVGAKLSLIGETSETVFRRSQIELGVSAAVVLTLAVGLVLISRPGIETRGD